MPEMIVQWVPESWNLTTRIDYVEWWHGGQSIKIGPIIGRFKAIELQKLNCLRFVDPAFGCIFNERQVKCIEIEIDILLSLGLSAEERSDCEKLRDYIALLAPQDRDLIYLRFCSDLYSQDYDVGEFLVRRKGVPDKRLVLRKKK
jgi:hypothetical protein